MEDYINTTSSGLQNWLSAAPVGTTIALLNDGHVIVCTVHRDCNVLLRLAVGLTTTQEAALQSAVCSLCCQHPIVKRCPLLLSPIRS